MLGLREAHQSGSQRSCFGQRKSSVRIATAFGLLLLASSLAVAQEISPGADQANKIEPGTENALETIGFAGRWTTTYGTLDLLIDGDRVNGEYDLGKVEGTVKGRQLKLTYDERDVSGVAEFELLEDGQSIRGRWRADGESDWQDWHGTRESIQSQFSGLWKMKFGHLRLVLDNEQAIGVFQGKHGYAELRGRLSEKNRVEFEFTDGKIDGTGWLKVSPGDELGDGLLGAWKPTGGGWMVSSGSRVRASRSKAWLVVLEANWETSLAEPQYAFGPMLKQYFTMPNAQYIQFRHRYFHDVADLKRFCRDVCFLADPVVLLLSTHGNPTGIEVFNDVITADEMSDCLVGLSNVHLLHLSGCSMMAGNYPKQLQQTPGTNMAISGYTTLVDWDTSAIADLTYLTMVLLKQLDATEAAEEAIKAAPYLGAEATNSKLFAPLGLTVLPRKKMAVVPK